LQRKRTAPRIETLVLHPRPGFDANQAWRQLLEERQNVAPLQLTADDHLASRINAVDLENRLGDVETDCRDRSSHISH
jgi:hypothetical protein